MQGSPLNVSALNDTGDETQRNFRYQHAYGVILLIGAAANNLPYDAVYAEHHEDYLCERKDGKFDGIQVKTRKPEEGPWDLSDEPIRKSIKRFVKLHELFEDYLNEFKFVSNANYYHPNTYIKDTARLRKSPTRLLECIAGCISVQDITAPFDGTLRELSKYCECTPEVLFAVLKKTRFVLGPDRNSFDSVIVVDHLPSLEECNSLVLNQLNAIRDELIQKIHYASSLKIDDPSKHWTPVNSSDAANIIVKAKRVHVSEVFRAITDKTAPPFRYSNVQASLDLGSGEGNLSILKRKMLRGDLATQILTMERRSLSTERRLIEMSHKRPKAFDDMLNQLVSVVQGECDEAYLHASLSGKSIGPQMLNDIYYRLKYKAGSPMVYGEPYDTLIGITGLLTGECKVWWSEKFNVGGGE